MHTEILAVDPGVNGAAALLSCDPEREIVGLVSVFDVPTYKKRTGRAVKDHLDLPALATTINKLRLEPKLAVIEQVGAAPGQGVTSMFRFGYAAGAAAGVCAGLGIDTTTVRPQHWQRWARKRPGKGASRELAVDLFPGADKYFKRAKDHDRADAVLIGYAYFCEQLQTVPQTRYVPNAFF